MPTDHGTPRPTYQHQEALAPRPSRRDRRGTKPERAAAPPRPPVVPSRDYAFRRH